MWQCMGYEQEVKQFVGGTTKNMKSGNIDPHDSNTKA